MSITTMIPRYDTELFSDIVPDLETFKSILNKYTALTSFLTNDEKQILFYLLYARYGQNPINNYTINAFEIKMCSIIFSYGKAWQKRLSIQDKFRTMTEADILAGAKMVNNLALNPNTAPSTGTTDELSFINQQSVNKYSKSSVEAYSLLDEALRADINEIFIREFRKLFKPFLVVPLPTLYVEDTEEE